MPPGLPDQLAAAAAAPSAAGGESAAIHAGHRRLPPVAGGRLDQLISHDFNFMGAP